MERVKNLESSTESTHRIKVFAGGMVRKMTM
jgi:hypothetical protein